MPKPFDWSEWDPRIAELHSKGWPTKEIWKRLCADGMQIKLSTFCNHTITKLRLYSKGAYGPRVIRVPKRTTTLGGTRWRQLGLIGDDPQVTRLCERPRLGLPASLTAHLMGDPRPGRTPWAEGPEMRVRARVD